MGTHARKGVDNMSEMLLQAILTRKQYLYYNEYRQGKAPAEIAARYRVDVSTVCRTLKRAKRKVIAYAERG